MKKAIDRMVCNTASATLIAGDTSIVGTGDFEWWIEELYLTGNGNWFLFGRGGAMTQYADDHDGHTSEGEKIIPMSRIEALSWCGEHYAHDTIDEHFGDLVEEA